MTITQGVLQGLPRTSTPGEIMASAIPACSPMRRTLGTVTYTALTPGQWTASHRQFLNYMFFQPFRMASSITIQTVAIEVTTAIASTTVQLGIFSASLDQGYPATEIYPLGTIDSSTTGIKAFSNTRLEFVPGQLYWVGWKASADTVYLRGNTNTNVWICPSQNDAAGRYLVSSRDSATWHRSLEHRWGGTAGTGTWEMGGAGNLWVGVQA